MWHLGYFLKQKAVQFPKCAYQIYKTACKGIKSRYNQRCNLKKNKQLLFMIALELPMP